LLFLSPSIPRRSRPLIPLLIFLLLSLRGTGVPDDTLRIREQQLAVLPNDTVKVRKLLELGIRYCSRANDRALLFLQQALTISNELGYTKGVGKSYLWQGRVYYYKDEYALAESYLARAKEVLGKYGDQSDQAMVHFSLACLYNLNGNFRDAIREYQEAVVLAGAAGNESLRATSLVGLGSIHTRMKEPDLALGYFREGLEIQQHIRELPGIASALTNIGGSYEEKNLYDSALAYYRQGYQMRLTQKDDRPIASSEYSLGIIFTKMKRYDEAVRFFKSALERYQRLEEQAGIISADLQMAIALNHAGDKTAAWNTASTALAAARRLRNPALTGNCYEVMAAIAAVNADFQEAYKYSLLHKSISDSINLQKKERDIREMEARFQLQRISDRMDNLVLQSRVQRKNIVLLSILLVTLLAALLLTVLLYRSKALLHRRQKRVFEQEAIIREQQEALAEKEKQRLREEVEIQNREMAAKALEMLRVNEMLGSIISSLRYLESEASGRQDMKDEISRIATEIELHTRNNSWQEFDTIFRNIHGGFYGKLLEKCPGLTATEIKIAALLRLNLSTKEIAAITLKSEEGVKSMRYRLRKKLNFTSDEHLIPYLMQL